MRMHDKEIKDNRSNITQLIMGVIMIPTLRQALYLSAWVKAGAFLAITLL